MAPRRNALEEYLRAPGNCSLVGVNLRIRLGLRFAKSGKQGTQGRRWVVCGGPDPMGRADLSGVVRIVRKRQPLLRIHHPAKFLRLDILMIRQSMHAQRRVPIRTLSPGGANSETLPSGRARRRHRASAGILRLKRKESEAINANLASQHRSLILRKMSRVYI